MTEDRKTPAMASRLDITAWPGLVRCMRNILAIFCLLMKPLAIPLGNPKTIAKWLVMFSVLCPLSSARADGIEVLKTEAHYSDGSYQLSADFNISFNFVVDQALSRGIPLYFDSEFTLTRPRWYWLDEVVAQSEQSTKLSYNMLTRQYRITRGSLYQNFASLDEALRIIGHQSSAPIPAELLKGSGNYMTAKLLNITEKLLKKDNNYVASVRLSLDVTQLPKPLQVNALTGNDWNLDSNWYSWIVRPDTAAHNKTE